MNYANRNTGWMLATMALVLCSGGTALAEDTELFVAGEDTFDDDSVARPNILFVIDTSGSMDTDVVTQVPWDSAVSFAGCYDPSVIYWTFSGDGDPGCSSTNYFPVSRNLCYAAVAPLSGSGRFTGDFLAWRQRNNANNSRWRPLRGNNNNQRNRFVECSIDAGVNGFVPGAYWTANFADGPYASIPDLQPSFNQTYDLVSGNRLNWEATAGTIIKKRLAIVQEVTNDLLDSLTGVNVGLMRFNNQEGGPVIFPMEEVTGRNGVARTDMQAAVNGLAANGWTPLSETLYEAHQYYAGSSVDYGNGNGIESVAGTRTGNTMSSNTYDSPIEFGCQKNYVIFLTDGEPTRDRSSESKIEALPDFAVHNGTIVDGELEEAPQCERGAAFTGGNSHPDDAICMDELAKYMQGKDMSALPGPQNVATYTIGFTQDLDILKTTAKKGGGAYYLADDTATLSTALTKIAVEIMGDSSTFAAPSVPVNAFNRTQSLNDIFVSVFNPSSTVHWPGNMKKYTLSSGELLDAKPELAIDPDTGYFYSKAQSYWSPTQDGDRSAEGGTASQLPDYTERKVFTNIAGGDLNSVANSLSNSNGALTIADFNVPDAATLTQLIDWVTGLDVFDYDDDGLKTDTRNQIGDPLHVRPVPVIYGGTAEEPDMVVYFSTNDGYFHAVDPDDGSELWAWVPEKLLPLMFTKFNDTQQATRVYGLDGEITATIVNNDFVGGISGDEQVILTFGMRRGGDSVFALDVTDRDDPQLLWTIDSSTSGFEDLGQTWSTPQISRVKVESEYIDVAIFGGGYDDGQDNDWARPDGYGNAIYMVDLLTGDKVWSAGKSGGHDLVLAGMNHSIPAPLRVIDLNSDGLVDRIYVGDMGARLWRYDIFNGKAVDELGQGGLIANMGYADTAGPAADVRRFFNQVDVVDYAQDGVRFLSLNVGSGYRAHPLDREIAEEFYSIRDFNPTRQLMNGEYASPVVRTDLVDITTLANTTLQPDDAGWRLSMVNSPGEKVLSRALTFQGTVYFTSFAPGTGANACNPAKGINRLYKVDILTGDPKYDLDESVDEDELTVEDRSSLLKQGSIAPQIEILFTSDDPTKGTGCVGTECEYIEDGSLATRTYWTQGGGE